MSFSYGFLHKCVSFFLYVPSGGSEYLHLGCPKNGGRNKKNILSEEREKTKGRLEKKKKYDPLRG